MSNMSQQQLAKAYIVDKTIENTHHYLIEGRQYADLADEVLADLWVATFRELAAAGFIGDLKRFALLDIESELGLRRLEIPMRRVEPELALFMDYLERRRREGRPDPNNSEEHRAELAALHARLQRPKH